MRYAAFLLALALAFAGGARLAGGAPDEASPKEIVAELRKRQKVLFKDLRKIERAAKDVKEIQEMRASGKYVITGEDKKLEKQGRKDLHIFMERSRNDTLEVLAIYERILKKRHYVEPLRRVFGKSLDAVVAVEWEDQDLESIVDELSDAYGVKMFVKGDINYKKTLSLQGEMSLVSILLYLENVMDAKLVVKDGGLWFVRVKHGPAPKKKTEPEKKDD